MMMNNKKTALISGIYFTIALLTISCSKKDDKPDEKGLGSGNVYFGWVDDGIMKINLESGSKSLVLPDNPQRFGFDVSNDQKKILVIEDVTGQYDVQRFKILNIADGTVIQSVDYKSDDSYTNPRLSPDGSLILCSPLIPGSVVILNPNTKMFTEIKDIEGKKLNEACWMPDGTVLLASESALYRSNKTFDQVSLVRAIDFDTWSSLAVSPDGKKIAFTGGQHIWTMDADGNNLVQVTESGAEEGKACFSPNGTSLLVGIHHFSSGGGPWGNYYKMVIIPADGKKYEVDENGSDPNVRPVTLEGQNSPEPYDSKIQWL